jgi:hypothetical protein
MWSDFISIFTIAGFLFFGREKYDKNIQNVHVQTILSKREINPLKSDFYFGNVMETMYNYQLCPMLNEYVRKTHVWSPNDPIYKIPDYLISHNFSRHELNQLNTEYMRTIYTEQNFPWTYRSKNVFINIKNETANQLYYNYCKDYFRGVPSNVFPFCFCIGMIITVILHVLGYVK